MPLHIIRQDITRLECDAIVNSANSTLLGGGGVDGAIHRVAGPQLLEECMTLGGCEVGCAKITKGYNLPSKYVIHTVGPVWRGGQNGELELLRSCYLSSLNLAVQHGCESVAFPLISSGVYGYPKDKALDVAVKTVSEFLFDNELTVYIVVFDKASYNISAGLFYDVCVYIDDNYVVTNEAKYSDGRRRAHVCASYSEAPDLYRKAEFDKKPVSTPSKRTGAIHQTLYDMLTQMDDSFCVTLLKLIDIKGMSDVECYKRANVSKQTWYKIMNERDYKPSKITVISFAIALRLSLRETKRLLATVGFTLSKSSKFDIIIEYFITNGIYDVFTINEALFEFDQQCLGA